MNGNEKATSPWENMARKFEEDEENLILAERDKIEEKLRLSIDDCGNFDENQLEKAKEAYINLLGYDKAMEILKGIL